MKRIPILVLAIAMLCGCSAGRTPVVVLVEVTATSNPGPGFSVGDIVMASGPDGMNAPLWRLKDDCSSEILLGSLAPGIVATVTDVCYNETEGDWFYKVEFPGPKGWARGEYLVTATQITPTSTITPLPSRTPDPRPPTQTPSPHEQCVRSREGIRYVIQGNGVYAVSLTYQNDMGGTDQMDHGLPFCKRFSGFERGEFLYISAQIIKPTEGAGWIECLIYDGTTLISRARAEDFPSIATCTGRVK